MNDDIALLRRFAETRSEEAFAQLVRQRLGFVYAVALRRTGGDAHLAGDAAQAVFLDLARKARVLSRRPVLVNWLHTSACFAAAKAVRSHERWRNRQQEAHAMQEVLSAGQEPAWNEIRPEIDAALAELGETDRAALLLRYFDDRPLAEVGTRLGLAENAARMRVDRALDKLRTRLARRGITSTAAALGTALAAQPAVSVPAGLEVSIAGAAVAGAGTGTGGTTAVLAALGFMSTTKLIIGAAVIAALFSLGFHFGALQIAPPPASDDAPLRQELARLRAENRRLQQATVPAVPQLPPAPPVNEPAPATAQEPAPRAAPGAPVLTETQKYNVVLGNLRQLRAAASQFLLENQRPPTSLGELVGDNKLIPWSGLRLVDGETYRNLNFADLSGPLTVTTANGQAITLGGNGVPNSPNPYDAAQARATEAFRTVNGDRTPAGTELATYFEGETFRAEFLYRAKLHAFTEEIGPLLGPAFAKAMNASMAATNRVPASWQDLKDLAPYVEDPIARRQVLEAWQKIDTQFGP